MTPPDDLGPRRPHGALRNQILGILIHADDALTARMLVARLAGPDGRPPALTTVLTVLDRLHRSGEVERNKVDGELRFTVARHDAETVADDMLEALLRSKDRDGALLSFAGALSTDDLEVLRRLVGQEGAADESATGGDTTDKDPAG